MAYCVARQPILNRRQNVYGYDLFYRDPILGDPADASAQDTLTSETISNSFHNAGIERVSGGKRAFVSFSPRLLQAEVPTLLPNKVLVVSMRDAVSPTQELLRSLKNLRDKGYLIAIGEYCLKPGLEALLDMADFVRFDLSRQAPESLLPQITLLKKRNIMLVADHLETPEQFETASELGFTLFSGNFFCKPSPVPTERQLTPLKANCARLIRLCQDESVNFPKIASIIKQDVALSYRLLRVVNSAFFGLRYNVKNIRQALAFLGMSEVKKWVTLISLAEIRDGKPDELVRISLIRARFVELAGSAVGHANQAEDLFMMGLMSLMDAIMDMPMADIIERTKISESIAVPLLTKQGLYADLLHIVVCYEQTSWDEALELAGRYGLTEQQLYTYYLEAIEWASRF